MTVSLVGSSGSGTTARMAVGSLRYWTVSTSPSLKRPGGGPLRGESIGVENEASGDVTAKTSLEALMPGSCTQSTMDLPGLHADRRPAQGRGGKLYDFAGTLSTWGPLRQQLTERSTRLARRSSARAARDDEGGETLSIRGG